jgi:nucleotide-binding universal stress UspA family protein
MKNPNQSTQTILVAIDGSLHSMMAARTAIQLAEIQQLSIYGIYVVGARLVLHENTSYAMELDNINTPYSASQLIEKFKMHGENVLQWLDIYCKECGVHVTTDLLFGGIPEIVLKFAGNHRLLAMGRCGYSNAVHPTHLGSNFKAIACHAGLPLLLGGDEYRPIQRTLVILDGNKLSEGALSWANELQKSLSSEIKVLLLEDKEKHQHWTLKALSQLRESSIREYELLSGYVRSGAEIVETAVKQNVDLIIMPSYRRIILGSGRVNNPLEEVLLQTGLPVLAL